MDVLVRFFILFTFISCAKINYIIEQTAGQVALEYDDIDAKDFIKDTKQNSISRDKVKLVLRAKNYFFNYFEMKPNSIYSEVKILDRDAVTYLVVYSPSDQIQAMNTWFPILGNFPYLGFFNKESAQNFYQEKKDEGFHTYLRKVYAYSTLNHPLMPFDDNILSSFFIYEDDDLIELIFHELTHTILFIGEDISFNENLASFVAENLFFIFKNYSVDEEKKFIEKRGKLNGLGQQVVDLGEELNRHYSTGGNSKEILKNFLNDRFYPEVKNYCQMNAISHCWPLKGEWNNARFAALGTYQNKLLELEKIFKSSGLSLKDFVKKLIHFAREYDEKKDFLVEIKEKLK